ncbi:MAG: hypothetical protein PVG65_00880 [Candidatus Thorarchaeota archaeon]|jgi:hypothetical protein
MDEGSKEELRVYSLIQELEDKLYKESELKKIFGFEKPLRSTRLYKYLKPRVNKKTLETIGFKILKGELVTGEHIEKRKPVLRGKYRITVVIDGVHFTYVKKGESNGEKN